jgi:hypothetical protein
MVKKIPAGKTQGRSFLKNHRQNTGNSIFWWEKKNLD